MPCWARRPWGTLGSISRIRTRRTGTSPSLDLLGRVMALLAAQGWRVENVDLTILAQRPKLKDYLPQMRQNYSRAMGLPVTAISVKATTEEGLGFTGTEQGLPPTGWSFWSRWENRGFLPQREAFGRGQHRPRHSSASRAYTGAGGAFYGISDYVPIPDLRTKGVQRPGAGGDPRPGPPVSGEISPTGCSYSVKIAARNLARALTILNGTRLPYLGIYVNAAGYGYREVEL